MNCTNIQNDVMIIAGMTLVTNSACTCSNAITLFAFIQDTEIDCHLLLHRWPSDGDTITDLNTCHEHVKSAVLLMMDGLVAERALALTRGADGNSTERV